MKILRKQSPFAGWDLKSGILKCEQGCQMFEGDIRSYFGPCHYILTVVGSSGLVTRK